MVDELKRILLESRIQNVDDSSWDTLSDNSKVRIQVSEITIGNTHLAFTVEEIGSVAQELKSNDPDGLQFFLLSSTRSKDFCVKSHVPPFYSQAYIKLEIYL